MDSELKQGDERFPSNRGQQVRKVNGPAKILAFTDQCECPIREETYHMRAQCLWQLLKE